MWRHDHDCQVCLLLFYPSVCKVLRVQFRGLVAVQIPCRELERAWWTQEGGWRDFRRLRPGKVVSWSWSCTCDHFHTIVAVAVFVKNVLRKFIVCMVLAVTFFDRWSCLMTGWAQWEKTQVQINKNTAWDVWRVWGSIVSRTNELLTPLFWNLLKLQLTR